MYKSVKFELTGVAPILMHNGQLADPLNKFAKALKELTGKREKTDDDYRKIADVEWQGGLYLENNKIVIPGDVIEAMFLKGAKSKKKGEDAKAGVYCTGYFPFIYKGPKNLKTLQKDPNFRLTGSVRIQKNKVSRTRPKFTNWKVTVVLNVNPEFFNDEEVVSIMGYCGDNVGLLDWRPKYGRFTVKKLK